MFCSYRVDIEEACNLGSLSFVGVLADEAENIAAVHDDVLLAKILDKEECEALKMGAYLGVAAASSNPPKFIHLHYTPPSGNGKTKLAIV
jgi:leucyl aminopeptidase